MIIVIPLFVKAITITVILKLSFHRHKTFYLSATAAWLAQLVERQSVVREVEGSGPRPDQHSGS